MKAIILIVLLLVVVSSLDNTINKFEGLTPANLPAPPYAIWAHYHWVWLHNSLST